MLCFFQRFRGNLSGTMNFPGRIFHWFTNLQVYVKIFYSGSGFRQPAEKLKK